MVDSDDVTDGANEALEGLMPAIGDGPLGLPVIGPEALVDEVDDVSDLDDDLLDDLDLD